MVAHDLVRRIGVMLSPRLTAACDMGTCHEERMMGRYSGVYLTARANLIPALAPKLSAAASDVRTVARERARAICHGLRGIDASFVEELVESIADDFELVAGALLSQANDPFVNGVWLSYVAGQLPCDVIEITGVLEDFLEASPTQARQLVARARKRAEQDRALATARSRQLESAVERYKATRPPDDILLQLFRESPNLRNMDDDATRIVSDVRELPDDVKIQPSWRRLIENQGKLRKNLWLEEWDSISGRLPALVTFLRKKYRGVALLLRPGHTPALLYLYAEKCSETTGSVRFGCFVGERPLFNTRKQRHLATLKALPPELQEFYRRTHDGWVQWEYLVNGPLSIDLVRPMKDAVPQADCYGDREPPFPLDQALELMRLGGGGDCLCLDLRPTRGSARAIRWYHEDVWHPDLDLDLWTAMNAVIRNACASMIPAT